MFCDEYSKKLCKRCVGCNGVEDIVASLSKGRDKGQNRGKNAYDGTLFSLGEFREFGLGSCDSRGEL